MDITLNEILLEEITKLDCMLIPPGFVGDARRIRMMQDTLSKFINDLGVQSARALGLKKFITTFETLQKYPEHMLYLLKDSGANGGRGALLGLLKIGRKHLYLYDEKGTVHEMEPMCILDFYVREEHQRSGLGRKLFDHMLKVEHLSPEQLPVDGLSPTMEQFLQKNYGISQMILQSNNFAVSPQFFVLAANGELRSGLSSPVQVPVPKGRYSAPKPKSTVGQIIHGGGLPSTGYSPLRAAHQAPKS